MPVELTKFQIKSLSNTFDSYPLEKDKKCLGSPVNPWSAGYRDPAKTCEGLSPAGWRRPSASWWLERVLQMHGTSEEPRCPHPESGWLDPGGWWAEGDLLTLRERERTKFNYQNCFIISSVYHIRSPLKVIGNINTTAVCRVPQGNRMQPRLPYSWT